MISQNLKNKKKQFYTILGLVLISLFTLTGCNFGDNNSKYVEKTLASMPITNEANREIYRKKLTEFYSEKTPQVESFLEVMNLYIKNENITSENYPSIEINILNTVIEYYNDVVLINASKSIKESDVNDFIDSYLDAIKSKNEALILQHVNKDLYFNSFAKSNLLDKDAKILMMLGGGLSMLMNSDGTKNMLVNYVLNEDQIVEEHQKTDGEIVKFVYPTTYAFDDTKIIIVDDNLALIEAKSEKDFTVYYCVAESAYGPQIFAIADSQQAAKKFALANIAKAQQLSPVNQKKLFDDRLASRHDELQRRKLVADLLEKITAYRTELQTAVKDNNKAKLEELINFKHLLNIKSVKQNFRDPSKQEIEFNFLDETRLGSDEKIINVANELVKILNNSDRIEDYNDKYFILDYIRTSEYGIPSDGDIVFDYSGAKLKIMYVIDNIATNRRDNRIRYDLYLKNADNISKLLDEKYKESVEFQKARERMYELLYTIVSISKVDWEVALNKYGNDSIINIKAIAQNISERDINLRYVDIAFVKNDVIIETFKVHVGENIPTKRGIRLNLNVNSNDKMVYLFSLVEKGEIEFKLLTNEFRYKNNYYTLPRKLDDMKLFKSSFGGWVFKDFGVDDTSEVNIKILKINQEVTDEYEKLAGENKRTNETQSIELVNKLLDGVNAELVYNGEHLLLSVANGTNTKISHMRFAIEFIIDNVIIGSYNFNLRDEILPNSSTTERIRVDEEMKSLLLENPKLSAKITEMRIDDATIKRGEAKVINGFVAPFLQNKGRVLFKSK